MNFLTVIALCRNERVLCPFFVRHYLPLADKIIVYDNQSTDGSREYLKQFKIEVREYNTNGRLDDVLHTAMKNNIYKKESSKWFCVIDFDEFIWHRDLLGYLKTTRTVLPGAQGYQMIGEKIPEDTGVNLLTDESKFGVALPLYNKQAIFHQSVDIRFGIGAHEADAVLLDGSKIKQNPTPEIKLLHYKWLSRELAGRIRPDLHKNSVLTGRAAIFKQILQDEYDQYLGARVQVIP